MIRTPEPPPDEISGFDNTHHIWRILRMETKQKSSFSANSTKDVVKTYQNSM